MFPRFRSLRQACGSFIKRVGGCQPAATHSCLTIIAIVLLIRSATTVARPQAVRPRIRVPSRLHLKCRGHLCRRGLNNPICFAARGSSARVCVPLKPLHIRQERQRFSSVSVPPAFLGLMWSISSLPKTYLCGLWQYSQLCCARSRTRATDSLAIIPDLQGVNGSRKPRRTASRNACALRNSFS